MEPKDVVESLPKLSEEKETVNVDQVESTASGKQSQENEIIDDNCMNTKRFSKLHASFGFPCYKRNNIAFLDDRTILYTSGGVAYTRSVDDNNLTGTIVGTDKGGIGALAVHPARTYFALGEKGSYPNIYVFSYPGMEKKYTLKNGTVTRYSDIEFSEQGSKMASVGGAPDFMLTVWDWQNEHVELRCKAFSQDIFRVAFSPNTEGRLTTSGTGHIRFWKMAETFTGLKLQGAIGKFGRVDLSDVSSFVELTDGKIISGSEPGYMLVWENDMCLYSLCLPDGSPCHKGMIEVMQLDGTILTTAGADGYVRRWEVQELEYAEIAEEDPFLRMKPINEVLIAKGARITGMINSKTTGSWIVQDASGSVWEVSLSPFTTRRLFSFHDGSISGMVLSPNSYNCITTGVDGSVRLWDVRTKKNWFSKSFAAACNTLTALPNVGTLLLGGFEDGCVRLIERCMDGFILRSALKVYKEGVVSVAVSPDGMIIATSSKDGKLFFLKASEDLSLQPIGFTVLPCTGTNLCWSDDSTKLLLVAGTEVIEIGRPDPTKHDTAKTFEIFLRPRIYNFISPKIEKLLVDEDVQSDATKDSKDGEGEDQKSAEMSLEELKPPKIVACIYSGAGDFFIAVDGHFCNRIFECSFVTKNPLREIQLYNTKPITYLSYSLSTSYLLIGSEDSLVQIRPSDDLQLCMPVWIHDMDSGGISNISLSFDDKFLVSAAKDGNMFAHQVDLENATKARHAIDQRNDGVEPLLELPDAVADESLRLVMDAGKTATDITDPTSYSLEQAKQQSEKDGLMAAAEKQKENMRREVEAIRDMFKKVLTANNDIDASVRLSRDKLQFDEEFLNDIKKRREEALLRAKREMQWELEKNEVGLRKLEKHFLEDILVENIEIKGLKNDMSVSSFRTVGLPKWMTQEIMKVHQVIGIGAESEKNKQNAITRISKDRPVRKKSVDKPKTVEKVVAQKERKAIRDKLKKQRVAMQKERPDENADDPKDVAAIKYAEDNQGDFKLKSDSNYVVPESQRVNAGQKRRQMVLLQESVNFIRMGLNERLLALRDLKQRIIERLKEDCARLNVIRKELKDDTQIFKPIESSAEYPENRYTFDRDDLIAFEKQLAEELKAAEAARKASAYGGGGDDTEEQKRKDEEAAKKESLRAEEKLREELDSEDVSSILPSALQQRETKFRRQLLQYEHDVLHEKITTTITTFDNAVAELRQEKMKLNADLQTTKLKQITLYHELQILKEFETQESELTKKLLKCRTSKAQVVVDLTETQDKLSGKLTEIQQWQEKDKSIMKEFDQIVGGEKNPFYEALKKIFKRKVKRANKGRGGGDDSGSDYSDSDSSDESSENQEDDSCPKDCDNVVYEKVMELREKRLDQEDILVDFQKSVEEIKSYNNSLQIKEKTIDKQLTATESEIQQFQTEKQQALNEISVYIPLKLSQIQCMSIPEDGEVGKVSLPTSIDDKLIFSSVALRRLKKRITELYQEKEQLHYELHDLKKMDKRLNRKMKQKQALIDVEKARCEDVQMLKYGQLVSLEVLDCATENEEAKVLQAKLETNTKEANRTLRRWGKKVQVAREDLSVITFDNTKLLHKVAELTKAQYQLDEELDWMHKAPKEDDTSMDHSRNDEMQQLVELAKAQATEIDALKAEIHMLQRKGGHLYGVQQKNAGQQG